MSDSPVLRFTPVPIRARRDGWTPERQRRFIALLAEGRGPSGAARAVGKTKQTAYALRERPGAASFAASWDAAVESARARRIALASPSAYELAMSGYLQPFFYRGEIVRVERRYANGGLMRVLKQLDRFVDGMTAERRAQAGEIALDTLLDRIDPRPAEADPNMTSGRDLGQLSPRPACPPPAEGTDMERKEGGRR